MDRIHQILKQYWQFDEFRPLQLDVIHAVLSQKDVIALMPTGGGKSICFQVPALAMDGLCLVISPLVALMLDQTENLKQKGVEAIAITASMSAKEIDIALDNCIYGKTKLLYVSPERINHQLFKDRVLKMPINLIAVDEAHCISQWGYDFRPAYLEISNLRALLPKVPLLAMTATATLPVLEDIKKHLQLQHSAVFKKSFFRPNIAFQVFQDEDKIKRLLSICNAIEGSGIVYVRNRRKTKELTDILLQKGLNAQAYHAGLPSEFRNTIQKNWMKHPREIIVCTNAFGMGIDKPDVRFVVHFDPPDSLEAYFQEAGRAGRDQKNAQACLLFSKQDPLHLEELVAMNFPPLQDIRNTYQALGNYYQIATGSGEGQSFTYNNAAFSERYGFNPLKNFNAIRLLEKEGYVKLSDLSQGSRLQFITNRNDLYNFQVAHPTLDNFIKFLLRTYGGLFDNAVRINEKDLGYKSGLGEAKIVSTLNYLKKMNLVYYQPGTTEPQLVFIQPRLETDQVVFNQYNLKNRREIAFSKVQDVIQYATESNKCRSQQLLHYFGETVSERCGICDCCKREDFDGLTTKEFEQFAADLQSILFQEPLAFDAIYKRVPDIPEKKLRKTIALLLSMGLLQVNSLHHYQWV